MQWIRGAARGLGLALAALVGLGAAITLRQQRSRRPANQPPPAHPPLLPLPIGETSVQVYASGAQLAAAMLDAIGQARQTIVFETFLWDNDGPGEQFKQALIERARAGVQVYVIYDRLASRVYASSSFRDFPELPTLHVLPYRSIGHLTHLFDLRRAARDHRKILVVDNQIGFVGGYNISKRWLAWRDTHMRLTGPAAADLAAAFALFWNREGWHLPALDLPRRAWTPDIRVYCNDSVQGSFPIRPVYLAAFERAHTRIWISQAYFVPDRPLLATLTDAARRGVDVRVLVPYHSEHAAADWLSRRRFGRCLRSGVRVFRYRGPILHAKTATIDGQWTMIGSANLDRLSLAGNHEINVELFSAALARQMEELFRSDAANAQELTLDQWQRRPLAERLGEALLAPFWPFV